MLYFLNRLNSFSIIILLVFSYPCHSQEKWGKVSSEILEMTTFPQDTTAEAVILFDVATQEISDDFFLIMKRHVRIKIMKENGKEFADVKIRFWHEDDVKELKAQTILPNGKKVELNKKDIFEESVSKNWRQKVFAIPGVEVGSVIEYRYEFLSQHLVYLEPWYFQNKGYTLLSQMTVTLTPHFNYTAFYQNIFGDQTKPQVEEFLIAGSTSRTGRNYTWKIENIPSLTPESYMGNLDDYRMAMFFQLVEYRDPYNYFKFIKEWEDLAKELKDFYKGFLAKDGEISNQIKQIVTDGQSNEERIRSLYDFVREKIETENTYTAYPGKLPPEVLKKGSGNRGEKSMLLVNMLRQAGFEACPMLISTRGHGQIKLNWPYLLQFNHLLVYVKDSTRTYFLDPGDKYCSFGMIPSNDLVEQGFLLTEKKSDFQKIPAPKNLNMWTCTTTASVTPEGSLSCNTDMRLEGYQAMERREDLMGEEHKKYLDEWIKDSFAQAVLDTFSITHLENIENPLQINLTYHVPEYAQVVGNNIYLPVPQFTRLRKNPFRKFERKFPVDYTYMKGTTERVTISCPEGYAIDEIPAAKNSKIDGMLFFSENHLEGNQVSCNRQFLIKKTIFLPSEYQSVKDFYSQVISYEESQVVLKKIAASP